MSEKNTKIEGREYKENEPGKRLYFYPRHKTIAESEEEAKKRKLNKVIPETKEVKKPKKQIKKKSDI